MPRLKASNNAKTQLASSVGTVDTLVVVNDASVFPPTPFRVTINSEIMEVTEVNTETNTLTVMRAQEGTTASSHSVGDSVECRFTAGLYNELVSQDELDAHSSQDASLTQKGHVQLSSTISTDETKAATPKAVKAAYDLASAAIPLSQKGKPNGVATLDSSGKIPSNQIEGKIARGTWSDTSTNIAANSTYLKTIPLPFDAKKGILMAIGWGDYGAIIMFDTNINNGIGFSIARGYESFNSSGVLTRPAFDGSAEYILIQYVWIENSTLKILFKNNNKTTSSTLHVTQLVWEVEG